MHHRPDHGKCQTGSQFPAHHASPKSPVDRLLLTERDGSRDMDTNDRKAFLRRCLFGPIRPRSLKPGVMPRDIVTKVLSVVT